MKKQRRNIIIVVAAITLFVMMAVTALIISSKQPARAESRMDPEINNPFIVFAPGFATLIQSGY